MDITRRSLLAGVSLTLCFRAFSNSLILSVYEPVPGLKVATVGKNPIPNPALENPLFYFGFSLYWYGIESGH